MPPPPQKQFSRKWQPVGPSPASPAHTALGGFCHSRDSHRELWTSIVHVLFLVQEASGRHLFCASCGAECGTCILGTTFAETQTVLKGLLSTSPRAVKTACLGRPCRSTGHCVSGLASLCFVHCLQLTLGSVTFAV